MATKQRKARKIRHLFSYPTHVVFQALSALEAARQMATVLSQRPTEGASAAHRVYQLATRASLDEVAQGIRDAQLLLQR